MPALFLYLLKLSISLSIVYLFYHLVLRRLTFYNSNRWYLIGYTLLSFLVPFVNITPVLENSNFSQNGIVQMIPTVEKYTKPLPVETTYSVFDSVADWNKWDWLSVALLTGAGILLLRFVIRCISFFNMRRKAELLSVDGMKLYQVNKNIIPFSFGNAVFINSGLHTEEELREIIGHEFVHVKQRHTLDILWSEWLCIINWYNPFAWMLKRSIRQNLEFIADNKVLQNGVDRKQYQYLLLKVIGNNHFSIAPKFNFSSLKKRIIMMNKLQSAKLHLVRFLFIVPLLAVILISFRQKKQEPVNEKALNEIIISPVADTVPDEAYPGLNAFLKKNPDVKSIGWVFNNINENFVVEAHIFKKDGSVEKYNLKDENDQKKVEKKYGKLPLTAEPPAPPVPPTPPVVLSPDKIPEGVKNIDRDADKVEIWLKNGKKESFDLTIPAQKKEFEKKYGALREPPTPPAPPTAPNAPVKVVGVNGTDNLSSLADAFEITDKKAIIHLKNGVVEKYDLTDKESRRKFEKKYGRIINTNVNAHVSTSVNATVSSHISTATNVNSQVNTSNNIHTAVSPVAIMSHRPGVSVVSTAASAAPVGVNVQTIDPYGHSITGEEEILVTITRKTTAGQLEEFKKQLKEKGIELNFDDLDFDNGKLVRISGTMKSKDGKSKSTFSVTDFHKVILASITDGSKTYFKVNVTDNKTVI